jgi:hypothetical protein
MAIAVGKWETWSAFPDDYRLYRSGTRMGYKTPRKQPLFSG